MSKMIPHDARVMFAVRSKMVDLRGVRTYMYEDTSCRLCDGEAEDINHVLNFCSHVTRTEHTHTLKEDDIYGVNIEKLKEVVKRINEFR